MRRPKPSTLAKPIALALVVFSVWASVFDKWSPESFKRPIGYCLDGMFTLALIRAGEELAYAPLRSKEIPSLGAPFVANWNDFPQSEDHTYLAWGLVARVTGVLAAMNLAFLSCAIGAALTLYGVARWLRIRWEASFVAAALFGLSPFLFYRSVHHFTLSNYWHVPLMVPLALWVARRRPIPLRSRTFRWAALFAFIAGSYNPYFLNYALQLVGLGILTQLFRKQWKRALTGVLLAAIAMTAFLIANLDTITNNSRLGPNKVAVQRSPKEVEIYSLRPLELFIPSTRHRLESFAAISDRHKANAIHLGEFPSMYLGIVGGISFLWLLAIGARALLLSRRAGWGRLALWSVWLIFVAIGGGIMQWLQTVSGILLFRSNNRVSIFLFALAMLFLARLLATLKKPMVGFAVCAVVLAVGVFDQTPGSRLDPNIPHWETVAMRERVAAADERLVAEAEKRLPPGTAVYQLPPMTFPEAGFLGRLPDYDQFRPWLFSKHLRFSYGNMKGRPEASWQNEVAAMAPEQRLAELKRRGFGAIYVLRNGYAPQQVELLMQSLRANGHEIIESDYGDSFFAILNPGATQ